MGRIAKAAGYTGHYVLLASYKNSSNATGSIFNSDRGIGIRGFDRPPAAVTCEEYPLQPLDTSPSF